MSEPRKVRHLATFEKDELLRFFLHTMRPEIRQQLMAKYPVHYAILYPTVNPDIIGTRVIAAIDNLTDNDIAPFTGPNV